MDKKIVNILKSYGCGYMADDYKEMIEEIETYVKNREKAINYTRCSTQLPNIYEGTLNNDRIKIIRTLADNYNVSIDTVRSLFNDGADFYKQTLTN